MALVMEACCVLCKWFMFVVIRCDDECWRDDAFLLCG